MEEKRDLPKLPPIVGVYSVGLEYDASPEFIQKMEEAYGLADELKILLFQVRPLQEKIKVLKQKIVATRNEGWEVIFPEMGIPKGAYEYDRKRGKIVAINNDPEQALKAEMFQSGVMGGGEPSGLMQKILLAGLMGKLGGGMPPGSPRR